MTKTRGSGSTDAVRPFDRARDRVRAGENAGTAAADFVRDLTLDQKLACLDGDEDFWPGLMRLGAGGYADRPFPGAQLPDAGFPGISFADGPRGIVLGASTCFPVSMARGATFDPDLEERIGEAIGRELRAQGGNLYGGVCVNLLRHPAWGRAQETYGEDPHHVGEMGAALARGVQRHAMACVKHYALNSIECARFSVDVTAGERALHEVYLPHFKRIVDEGIACVMSAYNSVNGEWCGESKQLLTDILREEWGFEGFVISDWIFGLRDAVKSVRNGLDIEMPYRQQRNQHVPTALKEGDLTDADIGAPVTRLAATMLRFDDVLSRPADDESIVACEDHRQLAYEAAAKSIVLLKNDGVLPLEEGALRRVAVIGRLAAVPDLGDLGSSRVKPPSVVTPLDGLRAALPGVEFAISASDDPEEAREAASGSDVALVVVGCTYEDEGEYVFPQPDLLRKTAPPRPADLQMTPPPPPKPGETPAFGAGGDRASLALSPPHQALIEAVACANPRTVVAMMGGSAIMVEGWHERVPAILMLWYPGMEGGRAMADILLGKVNPSGRLPFAVPTDESHLPPFDRDATSIEYGLFHGQWLLDRDGHAARFPFGFGLSYGQAEVTVTGAEVREGVVHIAAKVANRGASATTEVVQVYAGARDSNVERPRWRLAAFKRAEVPAGSSLEVEMDVPVERLAVRLDGKWIIEPGPYEFRVGRHAADPDAGIVSLVLRP